jgi:hypothetical protein
LSERGVAFDGTNIWVSGAPYLIELRDSDGAILFNYQTPGTNTIGVAFDGANVWVAGLDNDTVIKI